MPEAVAAVDRPVAARSERHPGLRSALRTDGGIHFSATSASAARFILSPPAAVRATRREILKSLLCVELLFTSGEYELHSAVFARENLVLD